MRVIASCSALTAFMYRMLYFNALVFAKSLLSSSTSGVSMTSPVHSGCFDFLCNKTKTPQGIAIAFIGNIFFHLVFTDSQSLDVIPL